MYFIRFDIDKKNGNKIENFFVLLVKNNKQCEEPFTLSQNIMATNNDTQNSDGQSWTPHKKREKMGKGYQPSSSIYASPAEDIAKQYSLKYREIEESLHEYTDTRTALIETRTLLALLVDELGRRKETNASKETKVSTECSRAIANTRYKDLGGGKRIAPEGRFFLQVYSDPAAGSKSVSVKMGSRPMCWSDLCVSEKLLAKAQKSGKSKVDADTVVKTYAPVIKGHNKMTEKVYRILMFSGAKQAEKKAAMKVAAAETEKRKALVKAAKKAKRKADRAAKKAAKALKAAETATKAAEEAEQQASDAYDAENF